MVIIPVHFNIIDILLVVNLAVVNIVLIVLTWLHPCYCSFPADLDLQKSALPTSYFHNNSKMDGSNAILNMSGSQRIK